MKKYLSKIYVDKINVFEETFYKCEAIQDEEWDYIVGEDCLDEVFEQYQDMVENVFDKNALCLDISELTDSVSKTFLYLIAPVFDYFVRNKKNIQYINSILKECIFEWDKILNMLGSRLCLLHHIVCLKDMKGTYWIRNPFKLYNLGMALVQFKKMDEDIELISLGETLDARQENFLLLVGIQENVTFWNYGLVSVLWDNFGYKYSSKYGFAVLNNGYLQDVIRIFKVRYAIFAEKMYTEMYVQNEIDIIKMFYLYSKHEIDLKCNSLRMQYAELAYMYSPFVEESRKKDIGILFDILWKVFCDCEIAKVYVEEYEYKTEKPINEVGSCDRTTRVHIIFSLKNNDIYSLRIDMPHKGVEYVHINLQEIQNEHVIDSAMPILCDEKLQEVKELLAGDMKKYFYESGEDLWWFRINFLKKIEEIDDEIKVEKLRNIFEKQKHFEVKISNDGYELFNEFKYYLKMYLSDFIQINTPIDILKEIVMYRCVLWGREMLEQIFLGIDTKEVIDKKICKYIGVIKKELYSTIKGFSESEWNEFTYKDVLEFLLDEFWNMN